MLLIIIIMDRIQEYMSRVFQSYKEIQNSKHHKEFWDLVILTTYDEMQKQSFEKQIEELFEDNPVLKELFLGERFLKLYMLSMDCNHHFFNQSSLATVDNKDSEDKLYVVADPPNQKLGCGGSTLHVLKTLAEIFGPDLYGKRVLIIHSGGCSQRLPSYSIQGKIFSPVPIKEFLTCSRVSHMIDLKLAMYLPFCRYLRPGIFITCSDDIETYCLEPNSLDCEALKTADVVALAHPCDLQTATGHGVYVLPDISSKMDSVLVSDCLEVLQKPSITLMREKKAVVKNGKMNEEMVYSDSVFWMSEKAYRPLLSWYLNTSLDSELDAYAHILPCLGINMKNYNSERFSDYRVELLPILKNLEFKVIILNESKFYHLGTMEEYLTNFTGCKSFVKELNIVKNTSNLSCIFKEDCQQRERTLVVSCYMSEKKQIRSEPSSNLVAEWCIIEIPIYAFEGLILSNCVLRKCANVQWLDETLAFYGSFLYHTVPLCHMERLLYVTVAFEIHSNLKQNSNDTNGISIASVPLDRVIRESRLKETEVLANGKPFSLWTLKLFHGSLTPEESFWRTHNFVNQILHWRDGIPMQTNLTLADSGCLFSMKEVVILKDLNTFLNDRKKLLKLINSGQTDDM